MKTPSIQDEIMNSMGEELRKAIDAEVVAEIQLVMLLEDGWVEPTFKYDNKNPDIGAWVHTHTQGEYKNLNGKWIFKNGADATAFTLKWA